MYLQIISISDAIVVVYSKLLELTIPMLGDSSRTLKKIRYFRETLNE